MVRFSRLLLIVAVSTSAGCGASPAAPTTTTTTPSPSASFASRIFFKVDPTDGTEFRTNVPYPPFSVVTDIRYAACGTIRNQGPGVLTYTLEMTMFGPSGEAYDTSTRIVPPLQPMGPGGYLFGCGLAEAIDQNLTHPRAVRYQLRLVGRFNDGTEGVLSGEDAANVP